MVGHKWYDFRNNVVSVGDEIKCNFRGAVVVVIVWQLDLQLPVQSVPTTTNVVSSNPANGEMYSLQHYVIKFVSDMRQVGGFLLVLKFPPPKKLTVKI